MIYIKKDEKVPLPKKYHSLNNLCAIIYDQLTEIFVEENYEGLASAQFEIDKERHILVEELINKDIHALDWLKENQLDEDLTTILIKNITLAITSDFVNFIYESLSCAKKGKMSVAYALLRKPFTDELLILEQILHDPHEFVQRFYYDGNPESYDPSSKKIDKKKIITNALSNIKPSSQFSADFIYDIRYEKSCEFGLNGISNRALHIVTSYKHYKTDEQNLNFVFSVDRDTERYWKHYYNFVPYLLIYSVCVIDSIIFRFLPDEYNKNLKTIKKFRRWIGVILYSERAHKSMKRSNKVFFDTLAEVIKLDCEACQQNMVLNKLVFETFFESEMFLCPKCMREMPITDENIKVIRDIIEKF